MKTHQLIVLAAVVAALALSMSVSACSSDSQESSTGSGTSSTGDTSSSGSGVSIGSGAAIVSFEEINQEYKDSVSKLDWPQNYTPPSELEGEEADASFQSGYGDTRASQLFECAWERQWLDTYANDEQQANKALEELSKVPSMGYMSPERADDSVRNFFKDYMDRAKLGDPSGFQENVQLNCPETSNG